MSASRWHLRPSITVDEARARATEGKPIESGRELVFALLFVSERIVDRTPARYFLNRCVRAAMAFADREEQTALRQEDL